MRIAMLERGQQIGVCIGGTRPVTGRLARAGVPFHSSRFLTRAVRPDVP
jgi:hypothetical protein